MLRMRRWLAGLLLLAPMLAAAVPAREDVVLTLQPDDLGAIAVTELPRLSVMRYRDKRWEAVPFQIDEMDEHGLVWFPGNRFRRLGKVRQFDGQDELLLMWSDGGQSRGSTPLPEGTIQAEIRVRAPDTGDLRFFYLVADNPQRSPRFYVVHDPESGVTRTERYLLTTDPDNELNWRFLGYDGYTGSSNASIVDHLRMNMSGGVLFSFARMTLDNENLRPELVGFKIGPIRSTMHLETRVVFAGLPMMKMHVQARRYANHYEAHTYARIPAVYRATLKQPQVIVSVDGNVPHGAIVRTARGGEHVGTVDGRIDTDEQALVNAGLSTDNSWILFDSNQDFALLTFLNVPRELSGIPLGLVYEDSEQARSGERFPGRSPELGYRLEGWPPEDELRFSLQLFFDSTLRDTDPETYVLQRSGANLQLQVNLPGSPSPAAEVRR